MTSLSLKGGRLATLVVTVYVFLIAIELLGGAFKTLGGDTADSLFQGLKNPFAGLAVGILATALVQSSSATTSAVVAWIGVNPEMMGVAVPVIMGANIGTSVTNTLVAMGHITRHNEFRRAFAGATLHDFFNILTVAILFPLEQATHWLQRSAVSLVEMLPADPQTHEFNSPIKAAVKTAAGGVERVVEAAGCPTWLLPAVLFVVAIAMIFFCLMFITRNMRNMMANRIEAGLNRILERSGALGLVVGIIITAAVQSSSITTSLLVPMFGAGILSLEAGFPVMVGANIGTTITALLAALVAGPAGLAIALVHLLFNLCGTVLFLPLAQTRRIPLFFARWLADRAVENRLWVIGYIAVTFILIPVTGIILF